MILATRDDFDGHLQQLEQTLPHLNEHNEQTRMEETFLAETNFCYLGCHVVPNGIMPQEKKVKPMLNIVRL